MTILPFTEARNRLSELLDEVEKTHERVTITRHGRETVVVISKDGLASLEETLDVLASPEAMRQLAGSHEDVRNGVILEAEDVAALTAERTRGR